LLLLRPPLRDEVPELQALLAQLRQRWAWLAGGYLVFFAALVLVLAGCGGGEEQPAEDPPHSRWPAHCANVPGACR
jgi:hypothetical protein